MKCHRMSEGSWPHTIIDASQHAYIRGKYKQAYLLCLLYELLHVVLAKVALAGVVARLHV